MIRTWHTRAAVVAFGIAFVVASGMSAAGEDVHYVVENGRLVFTNTPRRDSRPVPGFEPLRAARSSSSASPARLPTTIYDTFIERVAEEEGLTPELIKAVALVESGFNPRAVSPKGAQGLMQLMPATAAAYGVSDAFDPLENLGAGARHLRSLLDEFNGDVTLALAAYNAGSGAVRRHGGVPAYRETRDYVSKVKQSLGQSRRVPRAAAPPAKIELTRSADGTLLLAN